MKKDTAVPAPYSITMKRSLLLTALTVTVFFLGASATRAEGPGACVSQCMIGQSICLASCPYIPTIGPDPGCYAACFSDFASCVDTCIDSTAGFNGWTWFPWIPAPGLEDIGNTPEEVTMVLLTELSEANLTYLDGKEAALRHYKRGHRQTLRAAVAAAPGGYPTELSAKLEALAAKGEELLQRLDDVFWQVCYVADAIGEVMPAPDLEAPFILSEVMPSLTMQLPQGEYDYRRVRPHLLAAVEAYRTGDKRFRRATHLALNRLERLQGRLDEFTDKNLLDYQLAERLTQHIEDLMQVMNKGRSIRACFDIIRNEY